MSKGQIRLATHLSSCQNHLQAQIEENFWLIYCKMCTEGTSSFFQFNYLLYGRSPSKLLMQLLGQSWDLVVPTSFAIKSSWHQGPKVRAMNLYGMWKTGQRKSSMLLLMPLALTEQQIGTALLFLGHHCQIHFPAHWSDGQPRELWDFSCSGLLSFQQGVFAQLRCTWQVLGFCTVMPSFSAIWHASSIFSSTFWRTEDNVLTTSLMLLCHWMCLAS